MKDVNILFTKSVSDEESKIVKHEYNINPIIQPFIDIVFFDFSEDIAHQIKYVNADAFVFTSQNAVDKFMKSYLPYLPEDIQIYCVGGKTAAGFVNEDIRVKIPVINNSISLGEMLLKDTTIQSVLFFCGENRRDELPELLNKNSIAVKEIHLYKTVFQNHTVDLKSIDGISFFSPSSIESFIKNHKISDINIPCFVIGRTTKKALHDKGAVNIITAKEQNMKSMLQSIFYYFDNK